MNFENNISFAKKMDEQDPLSSFRQQFHIPQKAGKEVVYLCGNSLGLQPKSVEKYISQELNDWKNMGVEGHFEAKNPWFYYHHFLESYMAEIVGSKTSEVVVMNALTVNLNLLLLSFYRPTKTRHKIIVEQHTFPSDIYAISKQIAFHGFDPKESMVELVPREGEHTLRTEDIVSTIEEHGDTVALVLLGGVNYYTGQCFDMKTITKAAHSVGAYAGYDLAHAAGNVPLSLHDWEVDFACWCSYKYLNSGPGGVSGVFIHEQHHESDLPRLAGWWGHDEKNRFQMSKIFSPQIGASAWQMSNAPVIPMAVHWASLTIFHEAGMEKLRKKSIQLTQYAEWLLNNMANDLIEIITPKNIDERGCQLSLLTSSNGKELFQRLEENNVIADWREPNVIRVAPVPLYNTFEDVWRFVQKMAS